MIPENNPNVGDFIKSTEQQLKEVTTQKEDIIKRKRTVTYLSNAKDNIKKTLDYNGKLHWSKEEIELLRRVRAISNELGTITNKLKIIPEQQEGMTEINQQLTKQPVANIKVEFAENGEFSVIRVDTGEIRITGNKEKVKGFLDAIYITQQETTPKTE